MHTNVITECSFQNIVYIAGFVTHKLQSVIKCEQCVEALLDEKKNFLNSLICKKNRGGLNYPSKDVINICKISEYYL